MPQTSDGNNLEAPKYQRGGETANRIIEYEPLMEVARRRKLN